MTIKDKIEELVREASQEAQDRGLLPQVTLPDTIVERPQNPEHGDYATSLPLKLARPMRRSPMAIAESLVPLIPGEDALDKVLVAPPGFINFSLKPSFPNGHLPSEPRWLTTTPCFA